MTVEEIRQRLYDAAKLRMPKRDPDAALGYNIEQIEDYLTETAIWRGELEEARLYAKDALDDLLDQWGHLDPAGYEPHLATGVRRTQAAVDRAKALAEPGLHTGIREARRLVDRLTDQIKRLELDDKAASRRYTMMTGS
jgi:hypothetical protein